MDYVCNALMTMDFAVLSYGKVPSIHAAHYLPVLLLFIVVEGSAPRCIRSASDVSNT